MLSKRHKENMNEKICEAIRVDPLRPIREIHEECLNNVLHGIDDAEERIEFCQQMPTFRQCKTQIPKPTYPTQPTNCSRYQNRWNLHT